MAAIFVKSVATRYRSKQVCRSLLKCEFYVGDSFECLVSNLLFSVVDDFQIVGWQNLS
ncbi:hypothetical protein Pan241w_27710 [Gimesia alba]|uniref:Uncharacterized protein n=1 Tax=Gimesia alba TaxID=2527973 RepID=A0A517RFN1_9PLAN|nr:hypothetical protein Pan241w_27710 [Gimesia alba]